MSKSSQRRLAAKQAREKTSPSHRIEVPVGARGVVMQRNWRALPFSLKGSLEKDPAYAKAVCEWEAGEAQFLLFIMRQDGRPTIYEIDGASRMTELVDLVLEEFEARRFACALEAAVAAELKDAIVTRVGKHIARVSKVATQRDGGPGGIGVRRVELPTGKTWIVEIPRSIVQAEEYFRVLRLMDKFIARREDLEQHWMGVHLSFAGYENVPKELFEIDETRRFMMNLWRYAPWFAAIAPPAEYPVWFLSSIPISEVTRNADGETSIETNGTAMRKATRSALEAVGHALRCAGMEEHEAADGMFDRVAMALGRFLSGHDAAEEDPLYQAAMAASQKL